MTPTGWVAVSRGNPRDALVGPLLPLVSTFKVMSLESFQTYDSPNEAWRWLQQHNRVAVEGRMSVLHEFNTLNMAPGGQSCEGLLLVNHVASELVGLGRYMLINQDNRMLQKKWIFSRK